ncbi:hypothetical protein IEQ34_017441 [Dendrobium chrysotoxum]|uniref:RNase H type-1 domain-containing protein n=1 Tax=Dendrobium chrysotoxum TaxID=161865 RepID=A0AAV7GA59_DENCH|nr:hypothetical protein IEQ34_017441 [Dendrobium chrysotoxum]
MQKLCDAKIESIIWHWDIEMIGTLELIFTRLQCCSVDFKYSGISRNICNHGDPELSLSYIASNAISFASIASSNLFVDHCYVNQPNQLSFYWQPPPPGWIKVNLDASLIKSNNGGIGGVFRDWKGRFLLAFGVNCIHWDNGLLELWAFRSLKKIILEWMLDAKGIIIEGDNRNIISHLQNSASKTGEDVNRDD